MDKRDPRQSGVLIVGVGASLGLGAAIARRFAAGGYPVTIAGRNADKLEATLKELKDACAIAASAVGDASDASDAQRFVAQADELAPLAVCIHNPCGHQPPALLSVHPDRVPR